MLLKASVAEQREPVRSNPMFVYSRISDVDKGNLESKMQGLQNPIHTLKEKNNLFVIGMCIMMWDVAVWAFRREIQVTPKGKPGVIAVNGIFAIHLTRVRFHLWKPVMGWHCATGIHHVISDT